jgi:hypothetical protein
MGHMSSNKFCERSAVDTGIPANDNYRRYILTEKGDISDVHPVEVAARVALVSSDGSLVDTYSSVDDVLFPLPDGTRLRREFVFDTSNAEVDKARARCEELNRR